MSLSYNSIFLLKDGTVKACGRNNYGQLGIGNTTNQHSPVDVPISGVKQISCGLYHSIFLLEDGTVKACGQNDFGQLGIGNTTDQQSPVDVPISGVKQISCGCNHSIFLLEDGTVKACGQNDYGQLGIGNTTDQQSPVDVPISGVKQISCGYYHSIFLLEDGTVKACGINDYGQLGIGNTTDQHSPVDVPISGVKQISCGYYHSIFLLEDGTVKACGQNNYGQLGIGNTANQRSPVDVPISGVKQISCGYNHSIFLLRDGTVKACGRNNFGQLGIGNTTNQRSPVDVPISEVESLFDVVFAVILLMLIESQSNYYTYTGGWLNVGSVLSESLFKESGMTTLPDVTIVNQLESPVLQLWTDGTESKTLIIELPDTEIKYAVSMDDTIYYTRINGVWGTVSDIYNEGMSKTEIEAITPEQWQEIFIPGNLYIKAFLKTNDSYVTPTIDSITVNLPESFTVGDYYIITKDTMQLNTLDWRQINSCTIGQTVPDGTDVRFAFSNDNRMNWKVYKNGQWSFVTLDNLSTEGMTKAEVEALTSVEWAGILQNTLDVAVCLKSTDAFVTPEIDQITFDYDQIPSPLVTESIDIPVPELGFRYVLQPDESYELKMAQGLAFDDATVDYNFYTTPDKIKMRMLEVGTVIGGKASNIYSVEIINGYDDTDFDVTLRAALDGVPAQDGGNCALLPDTEKDENKTVVELSLNGELAFTPVYPLTFRLNAQARRLFYIRVKPTITTSGDAVFQILLSGRPV